jgi:hypothetical protein
MFGFDIIGNLENELEEMNKGKIGELSLSQLFSFIAMICKNIFSYSIIPELWNSERSC